MALRLIIDSGFLSEHPPTFIFHEVRTNPFVARLHEELLVNPFPEAPSPTRATTDAKNNQGLLSIVSRKRENEGYYCGNVASQQASRSQEHAEYHELPNILTVEYIDLHEQQPNHIFIQPITGSSMEQNHSTGSDLHASGFYLISECNRCTQGGDGAP